MLALALGAAGAVEQVRADVLGPGDLVGFAALLDADEVQQPAEPRAVAES
ncbi:MAG: hypothetical protein ACXVFT_04890 [Solirubrobacteraceae bacterium]